jgi:hypothetical protein
MVEQSFGTRDTPFPAVMCSLTTSPAATVVISTRVPGWLAIATSALAVGRIAFSSINVSEGALDRSRTCSNPSLNVSSDSLPWPAQQSPRGLSVHRRLSTGSGRHVLYFNRPGTGASK